MGYDVDKLYEGPRTERRAKRKKVNRVLNILIVLVIVLIVFFGGKLIFGDKNVDEPVSSNQTNQPADNEGKAASDDSKDKKEDASDHPKNEDTKQEANEESQDEQKAPESDEAAVVTEGDPDSNIIKTVENPAWKPIGTAQAEPHSIDYTENSVDRNEMEMAASYATGFDRSDMVVWWLGRNGGNSITATVSSKSTKQVQKVYLDWVPGEGWKPTKIEELKENDSETYKGYKNSEPDEDENEPDENENND
ncbi:YrrS family protein [Bacillus sp. REN16]|uniref:YrrS family protein n=1 Tax=Bacillus sp. REN16 TaxID=2887296 RepID=UPI001E54303D|nr:YrrS family protein [Bacillus sp. REN16]MCC3356626.1 YrrS family protein [Bacillus sp. REN16]